MPPNLVFPSHGHMPVRKSIATIDGRHGLVVCVVFCFMRPHLCWQHSSAAFGHEGRRAAQVAGRLQDRSGGRQLLLCRRGRSRA